MKTKFVAIISICLIIICFFIVNHIFFSQDYTKRLTTYLPDKKIGAIGIATNKIYSYENISLINFNEEEFSAIFIFPSAIDSLIEDQRQKDILHNVSIPIVLMNQRYISLGELLSPNPIQSIKKEVCSDIQFSATIREGLDINQFATELNADSNGFNKLTDYIIAFNINTSYESIDTDLMLISQFNDGRYGSIYENK